MSMDINELILKMSYAASQVAQSTVSQTQNQTQTEDGKSFQTLLEEKQTNRNDRKPAGEQETAPTEQAAANGATLQEMAAALLTDMSDAATVLPTDAAVTEEGAAVQMVDAVLQPVTTEAAAETAIPQPVMTPEAETELPQPQVLEQPQTETTPVTTQTAAPTVPAEDSQIQQPLEQVEVAVEDGGTTRRQEPELDAAAVQTDGTAKPLFTDTTTMPQRVGDAPVIDTEQADMEQQLTGKLTEALSEGSRRVEVRLTPEHLGRVVVEMQQDSDGILQVVLHAETPEAAKLLSQHSDALGLMLQGTQHTEVRVEVQQPQQDQPSQQQPDQNGGRNQGQQQQQRRQQADPERFLQQLRLGLLPQ